MKKPKFQIPSGMHDILPEDQLYFQKIYKTSEGIAKFYGFEKIETPIIEEAELFSKGIGIATDIVEKQMFTFRTKGGDFLALRPEGTTSIARAYIEHGMHNLPQPVKLWYFGPFFRYERPQAGRFRQFWQFGLEVFGEQSPVIDVQIIQIFYNILKELKFRNLIIEVNSIGCRHCRSYYRKLLVSYFKYRESSLCSNCRRRLRENPLRILDCKEEKCQRIITQAPQMIDHLCEECKPHFKQVLEFLDEMELPYHLNSYLVRGLDYYTKTVFEIFSTSQKGLDSSSAVLLSPVVEKSDDGVNLDSKEKEVEDTYSRTSALVGGGRFDALVKFLGGKDTPACGGAAGIDRMAQLIKTKSMRWVAKPQFPQIFLAQLGDLAKKKSLVLLEKFREAKVECSESFSKDSLKTQLGRANKIGARYCLILGQREALDGMVIIKDMKTGKQETVEMEKIVEEMKKRLK